MFFKNTWMPRGLSSHGAELSFNYFPLLRISFSHAQLGGPLEGRTISPVLSCTNQLIKDASQVCNMTMDKGFARKQLFFDFTPDDEVITQPAALAELTTGPIIKR